MRREHTVTPPETTLSRIPLCLNWRSDESWWRQSPRRTSEGEEENEIFASILWQHFSWLLGWGAANVSRGLGSILQICRCRSAELRVTVLQFLACVLRSSDFQALVCGVLQSMSDMVGQPGAVSVVQKNCNHGSIGRGKCICKLLHHTPDYSLSKHWKFSVWPAGQR